MKVVHLSDLHLGKSVLEQSMVEDQKYILNEIIDIVKENQVDVVLIAGDVYDKNVPSVEAVHLFSDFLTSLYKLKIKVLVIAGNHDSRDRLIFGNELLMENGVYIEGVFSGELKKVVLEDRYGNINFYMLPFVKPADVRGYFSGKDINSYDDAVRCIINSTEINVGERNLIMVHQFVTASGVELERSDSEVISLGGVDNIDVSLFDDFDYVALGHIHGAQKLIRDTVRYAGSPLKYSFSEVHQRKSVPVIEFKEKGDISIELIDLVPFRDMRVIKGPMDRLLDKNVVSLENTDDYIGAVITDEDYVVDAIGKLRGVYKNLLRLEYQNSRTRTPIDVKSQDVRDIEKKDELELFCEFYRLQNNIDMDFKRKKIFLEIVDGVKEKGL